MRVELELPNERRTILVDPNEVGTRLTALLRKENLPLNTRCGERFLCQACGVEVKKNGTWMPEQGCQVILDRDLQVRVPAHAMLAYQPQILSDYRINVPHAYDPILGKTGLGVVVDIGTTTVALCAVDLSNGRSRRQGFGVQPPDAPW